MQPLFDDKWEEWFAVSGYMLSGTYLLAHGWRYGNTESSSTQALTPEEERRIREQVRRDQQRRGDRRPQ